MAGQLTVTAWPVVAAVPLATVTGDPPVVDTVTVRVRVEPASGVAVTEVTPGLDTVRSSSTVGSVEDNQASEVVPGTAAAAVPAVGAKTTPGPARTGLDVTTCSTTVTVGVVPMSVPGYPTTR